MSGGISARDHALVKAISESLGAQLGHCRQELDGEIAALKAEIAELRAEVDRLKSPALRAVA